MATGSYLSPTNAVIHLAKKLGGAEEINVVVMMVCAKTQTEFMQLLQAFSTVFPLPVFSQVERMTKTAESLQVTKMQLPALPFGGLPTPQTISTSSSRDTLNAQLIAQAKNSEGSTSGIDAIKSALASFNVNRESVLNAIDDKITGLLGQSMVIWNFIGTGTGGLFSGATAKRHP